MFKKGLTMKLSNIRRYVVNFVLILLKCYTYQLVVIFMPGIRQYIFMPGIRQYMYEGIQVFGLFVRFFGRPASHCECNFHEVVSPRAFIFGRIIGHDDQLIILSHHFDSVISYLVGQLESHICSLDGPFKMFDSSPDNFIHLQLPTSIVVLNINIIDTIKWGGWHFSNSNNISM